MSQYFSAIPKIDYTGPDSDNHLSYHYYDADRRVLGKTMAEHLRLAICYWHTFCWQGNDAFGAPSFDRAWLKNSDPMQRAHDKADAAFEFISKLGVPFITFHDRDIAPEADNLRQTNLNLRTMADYIQQLMEQTGIRLLWGTANLFSHPRYMAGAATNPDPEVFSYAIAQMKQALDITLQLKGENYVLWGGREGYDTLLNTDLKLEQQQYARFLQLLVDYKHKIGFKGTLLIEPKPCEPTKHQYDFDTATVLAFLEKFGLEKEFKVNIEANHATLAGHSFEHEIAYACAQGIFGSIDANRGDPQLGWDTDQFPIDIRTASRVLYIVLQNGGFHSGGFNFDTKLRRQSIDNEDLFYAHISGIDTLARGLLIAANMIEDRGFSDLLKQRYLKWRQPAGQALLSGELDMETITEQVLENNIEPKAISGRQEYLENLLNQYL